MRIGVLRAGAMVAVTAVASCSPEGAPGASPPSAAVPPPAAAVPTPTSNILAEDYVGPQTCTRCHAGKHASWMEHPHRRMNAPAEVGSVLGDFSGTTLSYADGAVVFRRDADRFLMEYFRRGKPIRTFRVTRTIGWRYLQEYVGVQVRGPEPSGDALYTEETRLKFGYVLKERRWLPQSYLDSPNDGAECREDGAPRYDPFEPERTPFNTRCIHCHNTYPYELRLYTDERLLGFPRAPDRAIESLLRARPDHLAQRHNPNLPTRSLTTVGISCESCHFGGREHSENPKVPMRFVPTHPELSGWTPDPAGARKNPAVINALCRQCHFSGGQSWADGSAILNSMESIEQDRGACASRISCASCHDPHVRGPNAGSSSRPESVAACVSCHQPLRSPEAARAHGRHDPGQVSCLDCHMPRIVHGFDAMNRTHRISSPTELAILGSGMPNACNLCHLDRSLAWTRDALDRGWGKRIQLPPHLEAFFGKDHSSPAGEAWLAQPVGMLRVVAGAAYARSPLGRKALPLLLRGLEDPNAYLRTRSLQNVEHLLGRRLEEKEYALTAPPERRREQIQRLQMRHSE